MPSLYVRHLFVCNIFVSRLYIVSLFVFSHHKHKAVWSIAEWFCRDHCKDNFCSAKHCLTRKECSYLSRLAGNLLKLIPIVIFFLFSYGSSLKCYNMLYLKPNMATTAKTRYFSLMY